ncbi:unnamed protein product [Dovyalis caffra]|uniref:Uncharacterized protein n=1 Tax=Dovyalis caffra TaxID=77055 RepID=A0AAV1RQ73_9ROSI|nr:unnamed protein product [Dovyalis caffra]
MNMVKHIRDSVRIHATEGEASDFSPHDDRDHSLETLHHEELRVSNEDINALAVVVVSYKANVGYTDKTQDLLIEGNKKPEEASTGKANLGNVSTLEQCNEEVRIPQQVHNNGTDDALVENISLIW